MITWLVSYPRSGNTYLRILLNKALNLKSYSIHGDKTDIAENAEVSDIVGHLDFENEIDLDLLRNRDDMHYIKSHCLPDSKKFNFSTDRFIYIVRDGREASLSYHRYLVNIAGEEVSLSDVIVGNVSFGSWGNHLSRWSNKLHKIDNSVLLKFEDLLNDFDSYFPHLCEFITNNNKDFDVSDIPSFLSLHELYPDFFRSGKKSSWEQVLSPEQIQIFSTLYKQELVSCGYHVEAFDSEIYSYAISHGIHQANLKLSDILELQTKLIRTSENSLNFQESINFDLSKEVRKLENEIFLLRNSFRFKLGCVLLSPLDWLRKFRKKT